MSALGLLRSELAARAEKFAIAQSLPYCVSYGKNPAICFQPFGENLHGNFHPVSFRYLKKNPEWHRRLGKVHSTAKKIFPSIESGVWKELDSCMSSDALLMNVFCHPEVRRSAEVAALLGVSRKLSPQFGFRARVPLRNGGYDRTEVDMKLGDLIVEAKLTESDFQRGAVELVARYRDFADVFEESELPRSEDCYEGYQLIRNVLAAFERDCSLCVLLDARRPDLVEAYYAVMKCVRPVPLRTACKVLTWQELAQILPVTLRSFLAVKYGIEGNAG